MIQEDKMNHLFDQSLSTSQMVSEDTLRMHSNLRLHCIDQQDKPVVCYQYQLADEKQKRVSA